MALQHRDFAASRAKPRGRVLLSLAEWLIVPPLRLACRVFPPLDRALGRTTGGLQGNVFRHRDRGDHRAAFDAALEGLARQHRTAHGGSWRDDMRELQWWTFLHLAAGEAEHLGEQDRAQVIALAETARSPGGMLAAWCLRTIASWRWSAGDTDAAVSDAKRAVLADASWPHGHLFVGWLGLVSGRFDPLPHLREALRVDASCAEAIRETPEFAHAPGLLRSLGLADARAP